MKRFRFPIFLAKKVAGALITIILVMSIFFVLLHSIPGGDVVTRMIPFSTAQDKAQLRAVYGLTRPLYEQYFIFMKKVFTLDFRLTYDQEYTSLDTVLFFLPYTLLLFGTATILCYAIGVFLGIKLLSRKSKRVRTLVTVVSVIFYAIPAFVFAISCKNWFIFKYHLFPPVSVSMGGLQNYPVLDETLPFEHADVFWDLLPAMVLPLSIIVIVGLARPLLLLKDHMTLLLDEPYVTTAKAKGLTEPAVLSNHVARNALLPLFNDASINLALIFSGGILIEYIFSWPGIGTLLFISLRLSYYPTILAAIFLLTIILLIFIVTMDVLNAYVDPRVMQ